MRRTLSITTMMLLLAVLFALGGTSAPSNAAQATAAATQAATKEAVAATKAATPVTVSTPEAASEDDAFVKAPAPEAGSLGVTLSDADPVTVVSTYPNGPAEKAGIQPGDELLEINGKTIKDRVTLIDAIVAAKPGDTLTFIVNRDGDEQEIKVPVKSRRDVYCPVPEKKFTEDTAVMKDILSSDKNWTLAGDSTDGVDKVVKDDKLTFSVKYPDEQWVGLVNLRSRTALEYSVTVEITQTGRAVAGILLNVTREDSYRLQFIPNGSWQMSALIGGQESSGGVSFGESLLNAQKKPTDSVTNTIRIVTDGNDMFFYFNGKFACGVPLFIFADPPLDAGGVGLYAVVDANEEGKYNVVFSKVEFNTLKVSQ